MDSSIQPEKSPENFTIWDGTTYLPKLWSRGNIFAITALFIVLYIVASAVPSLLFGEISATGEFTMAEEAAFPVLVFTLIGTAVSAVLAVVIVNLIGPKHSWIKLGFQSISGRWIGIAAGLGAAAAFVRMLIGAGLVVLFPTLGESADALSSLFVFEQTWQLAVVSLMGSLLVPFYEELFFRGFVHNAFRNRFGMWGAIIGSSLVFGIFHVFPIQVITAFLLGLVLGWLYERSASVWAVFVAHAVNNGIAFGLLLIADLVNLPV